MGTRTSPALLALPAITCAGLYVRLLALDRDSLWFDEALEFQRATGSLRTAVFGRPVDQDPPLLPLFNHVWFALGNSEWWLRAPSVLLGTAAVFLMGRWALRRFGARTALISALVMALAPVQVHYSRELNQYAAVSFLTLAAMISWERVLSRGSTGDWARHAGVTVIGLGTHYGLVFPLVAMGLHLAHHVLRGRFGPQRRRLLAYSVVSAMGVAMLLWLGLADRLAVPHLQRRFGGTHLAKELDYIGDIGWREILVFFLLPFSGGPALWIVSVLSLVAAIGAVVLWRAGPPGRRAVGVCFFGALATTYPADVMGWYPMGHRYVLFAAVPFLAALAAGVDWVGRRARAAGVVAAVATCGAFVAFGPHEWWPNPWLDVPREELRPVVVRLAAQTDSGSLIYVYYGAEPAFRYYYQGNGAAVIWGGPFDAVSAAGESQRIAAGSESRSVWLVYSHERAYERAALDEALADLGLIPADEIAERNAVALRFERQSSVTPPWLQLPP